VAGPESLQSVTSAARFDTYLVGVGGQGILTIAEILAEAAAAAGLTVSYFPSKGMAQRGGFVKAQVRLGHNVVGPNIPERGADLVIALERSEALKAVRFVKADGEFLLYNDVWAPTAVMLGKATYPTIEQVQSEVRSTGARLLAASPQDLPVYKGRPVSDNVFVLGLVMGHTALAGVLDEDAVAELLTRRWRKAADRNLFGYRAGLGFSAVEDPLQGSVGAEKPAHETSATARILTRSTEERP
jgi:indolepyruvate ferredoxin oxidoreductase, beta subunit